MPSYSGVWSLSQQFQARGQGLWPALPGAPTIGAATLVTTTSATVAFTAPACTGVPAGITGYQAISTPGCITATGASSPVTVSGLAAGTAYTFQVRAQNATGYGSYSASSNSVQARVPGAPTIGTASAGNAQATVTFSAPACVGSPGGITSYTVTSTPGSITGTGASSPITVSGLANGTAYTFRAKATNAFGTGACSAASNSVTPAAPTDAIFASPGTFTWVAPAGVTSVSVIIKGAGGNGASGTQYVCPCTGSPYGTGGGGGGGGGGFLSNNIAVTPGSSYTVRVGTPGSYNAGNSVSSYFISSSTRWAGSGSNAQSGGGSGGCKGGASSCVFAGNGAQGGDGGGGQFAFDVSLTYGGGGGGAAGYAYSSGGFGGAGGSTGGTGGSGAGAYGGGGGGRGGSSAFGLSGQGGGGVGIYGNTADGAAGGGGGSGGSNGTTSGGGAYGGGGGGGHVYSSPTAGASGVVRIVWPGTTRQFPSTNVGP